MEFWFVEYDRESFDRPFLKVDFAKYLKRAITSLPHDELNSPLELSESRAERLLQDQLLEQHGLLVSYFDELNSQVDDQKSHFKDFIRITSLYLQVESLYTRQYWEFDVIKDFILNRLFAAFIRFSKFLQSFHSSLWLAKLRVLKTTEFEENGQIDKIFSNSLVELARRGELILKIEEMVPFQQYFQISLETLAKSLDRSVSTLSKEKLFINQLAYVARNYLDSDLHFVLQDCKSRFADSETFLMQKILQENESHFQGIIKMQQDMEYNERKKSSNLTEKELAGLDPHIIDAIFEGFLEQYNPNSKRNSPFYEEITPDKVLLSRQPTSGGSSQRDSTYDQSILGSQKNLGGGGKNRKTFLKGSDFESQRKTLLTQEDKKSKNSAYALLIQNTLNPQKKNSRNDSCLKVKSFGTQRTISSIPNREKSDSITEAPKEQNVYNPNVMKSGARFDKDSINNYSSIQPAIDYQHNLDSALEDDRYRLSPNFVRNNYENPLLRYIHLSSAQNEDGLDQTHSNQKKSLSIYASFGLLDRATISSPKRSDQINKAELFSQMNEKLNVNLLDFLTGGNGNLAEIRPEDIKFDRKEEKNDEMDPRKKKKNLKESTQKLEDEKSTHIKTQSVEEKETEEKKKNQNFFSKNKNKKKEQNEQKFKKINEKDFIKIDENTEIKGKLEYVDIDELPAQDIKDYELFDLNYKSEEETMKTPWGNNALSEDNTFKSYFDSLEREEYISLIKKFSPNNPREMWKKVRSTFSADVNLNFVMTKILGDKKTPDIKRRDFGFKKKHKVIACNLFGQNIYA